MISFASATGNLFNRLGKLGNIIKQLRSYQSTQYTNMIDPSSGIEGQYEGEPDIQAINGSAYISLLNSAGSGIGSTYQSMAEQTINRMVFRDNPRINQTLTANNTLASIQEVIRQMGIAGASVLTTNVTATIGTFQQWITNTGNGVLNCSTKRPLDGRVLENAFSEDLLFTCTQDSYTGGATEGNETFSVTGVGTQDDYFAFNWPLGSNCSLNISAIDGNSDNTSGNILTNSGFEDWTDNVPDNWTLVLGTAGTNINQENSINYQGDSSCRITGDASGTLTQIKQAFNLSTGTSGDLASITQYSFCIFLRRDGNISSSGQLTIDLANSGDVILNDENGVANSFTIDLTTLTTEYASYTGIFRTPIVLPSQSYIRIRLSQAYDDSYSFYLDFASLGIMTQCYTSGPFVALHAGSEPFVEGDYAYTEITNARGSGGTLITWQTMFANLFPIVYTQEIILPSSNTPTISDSLIG